MATTLRVILTHSRIARNAVIRVSSSGANLRFGYIHFVVLGVLFCLTAAIYFTIDYSQQVRHFGHDTADVDYNRTHHLKKVILPMMKYKRYHILCVVAYGVISIFGVGLALSTSLLFAAGGATVVSGSVSGTTTTSTTLHGITSPDRVSERGFEYGKTTAYGIGMTDSAGMRFEIKAQWGANGTGNGQLKQPYGIEVDRNTGDVYVADTLNNRVQKFDQNGNYLTQWGSDGTGNGQFSGSYALYALTVDSFSNVYVADTNNHRVQKFDQNGNYLTQWGSDGTGNGQFKTPQGIAVDNGGNVYVSDTTNHRVQKFDQNGNYLTQWGSYGTGNGQFKFPEGIAVDSGNNIYIAEAAGRVQKFDQNGNYLTQWGSYGTGNGQFSGPWDIAIDSSNNVFVSDPNGRNIQKFDQNGTFLSKASLTNTNPSLPEGISVDSQGNLYVLDGTNYGNQVQKVSMDVYIDANITGLTCGTAYHYRAYAVDNLGTAYGGDKTFETSPCSVVVTTKSAENIRSYSATLRGINTPGTLNERGFDYGLGSGYGQSVSDNSMQQYGYVERLGSQNGGPGQITYADSIASDVNNNTYVLNRRQSVIQKFDPSGNYVTSWGSEGTGAGQFNDPNALATDKDGNIYVADYSNLLPIRIQKFDSSGTFISGWSSPHAVYGNSEYPTGLAVDSSGAVYLSYYSLDQGRAGIQKFDTNGTLSTEWGSPGSSNAQFNYPQGIVASSQGNIYVVDSGNNRVQKFDSNGNYLSQWGSGEGSANGQFGNASGIAIDSANDIYIADTNNNRVQKFDSNGAYLDKWSTYSEGNYDLSNPRGLANNALGGVYVSGDQYGQSSVSLYAKVTSIDVLGLSCDTLYHYRAYGIDGSGTYYGDDKTVITGMCLPNVSTRNTDAITAGGATLHGTTTSQGVFNRGFQYGINANYGNQLNDESQPSYTLGQTWGSAGTGNGQFSDPKDIARDSSGNIFVADYSNNRIQKFDRSGNYITQFGSFGYGNGQFSDVSGIAINSHGQVYVTDSWENRIQIFDNNGVYLNQWTDLTPGTRMRNPVGIAIDKTDSVYVILTPASRIIKFDSSGNYVTSIGNGYGSGDGQFDINTQFFAIGSDGSFYVADTANNRVQKFDSSGNYLTQWGSGDTTPISPLDITLSPNDDVYVSDTVNHRIQKFDSSGSFITQWIDPGAGGAQLGSPLGIVVSDDGSIIAGDVATNTIHKFDQTITKDITNLTCGTTYHYRAYAENSAGSSYGNDEIFTTNACAPIVTTGLADGITTAGGATLHGTTTPQGITGRGFQYGTDTSYGTQLSDVSSMSYSFSKKWGSLGSGVGQFSAPQGIARDSSGNFYVLDAGNYRIQKFDSSWNYVSQWGSQGTGDGQFSAPVGIAIDSVDTIYVADASTYNIQKFDTNGHFLGRLTTQTLSHNLVALDSVTVDSSGDIYGASSDFDMVFKWDSTGNMLMSFGGGGTGNGQFRLPRGIAISPGGDIYVADQFNYRIQKFDASGNYISQWGSGDEHLIMPLGITLDTAGDVYVSEYHQHRVQKFDSDGNYLTQFGSEWGGSLSGDGQLNTPFNLSVTNNGSVYVADTSNNRIQEFDQSIAKDITGLTCGTTYHYRAYALNNAGTTYGNDATFTTPNCNPVIINVGSTDLPRAVQYKQYSDSSIVIGGGYAGYSPSVKITAGSLPAGMYLGYSSYDNSNNTTIYGVFGTPESAGSFSFTVTATSPEPECGCGDVMPPVSDTVILTLIVDSPPSPPEFHTFTDPFVTISSVTRESVDSDATSIRGSGPAYKTITLFVDGIKLGTTQAGSTGLWSYASQSSKADLHSFTAKWIPTKPIAFVPALDATNFSGNYDSVFTKLLAIDTEDNTIVKTITLPNGLLGVDTFVNQQGTKVYILGAYVDSSATRLLEFDIASGHMRSLGDYANQNGLSTMTLSSDGLTIYLLTSNGLQIIDMVHGTNQHISLSTLDQDSFNYSAKVWGKLAVNDSKTRLFIPFANHDSGQFYRELAVVNLEDGTVAEVNFGAGDVKEHLNSAQVYNGKVYLLYGDGSGVVLNADTASLLQAFDIGLINYDDSGSDETHHESAVSFAVNGSWDKIYVSVWSTTGSLSNSSNRQVAYSIKVLDLATSNVESYVVPSLPMGITFTSGSNDLFMTGISTTTYSGVTLGSFDVSSHTFSSRTQYASSLFFYARNNGINTIFPPQATALLAGTNTVVEITNPDPTPPEPDPIQPKPAPQPRPDNVTKPVPVSPRPFSPYLAPANPQPEQPRKHVMAVLFATVIFPWLLLVLLLATVILAIARLLRQLKYASQLKLLVQRQEILNAEKKSLLSLMSHYLRTPLTILSGGIDLLPSIVPAKPILQDSLQHLHVTVEAIIAKVEDDQSLGSLQGPQLQGRKMGVFWQKEIVVPVLAIGSLLISIHLISSMFARIQTSTIQTLTQIVCFVVLSVALYVIYDFYRKGQSIRGYQQQLLAFQEALDSSRNQFMQDVMSQLAPSLAQFQQAVEISPEADASSFIAEGLKQLEGLAGNFALISQLEQRNIRQMTSELDLASVVSSSAQMTKHPETALIVDMPTPVAVRQPEFMIRRVLSSLLDNAAEHNRANTAINVVAQPSGSNTVLDITDHGDGIPAERMAMLFKPLGRVEDAEDFTHQGLGLGLFVSRLIMHYLGGDIHATSIVGQGTRMSVQIPNNIGV